MSKIFDVECERKRWHSTLMLYCCGVVYSYMYDPISFSNNLKYVIAVTSDKRIFTKKYK